ncbi:MAG TPA: hypothetical protein VK617_15995 [Gemmatimonadaceae bacterium]|nr:hypothetical protein [Gemmatimonadaceae bacterium]
MMRALPLPPLALLVSFALLAPSVAAQQPTTALPPSGAPTGQCDLIVTPNSDSTHFSSVKLPSGEYNNFVGGGITGHCPVQQITLVADSAEWFGDLHMWHLVGHVHYVEPRLTMDSDVATYYLVDEHLVSEGNVHTLLPSGTTLVGPHV